MQNTATSNIILQILFYFYDIYTFFQIQNNLFARLLVCLPSKISFINLVVLAFSFSNVAVLS